MDVEKIHFYMKNGILHCQKITNDELFNFNESTSKTMLEEFDKKSEKYFPIIKQDKITSKNVLIYKFDNKEIKIDFDKELFYKYFYLVRKIKKNISKLYKDYLRQKYLTARVKKALKRGAFIGGGALASILLTASLHKDPTEIDKTTIPTTSIENYQDDTLEYLEEKVAKETVSDNIIYTNSEYIALDINNKTIAYSDNTIENIEVKSKYTTLYSDIDLEVEDLSNTDDAIAIREKYESAALSAEEKYGIDHRIILAMLTQESHGNHINLMQIEFNSNNDEIMTIYNFKEEKYMKVVITNNPDKYYGKVDFTINEEELKNPYTQICTAAILMNYCSLCNDTPVLNPCAIIDKYNKGIGNFDTILNNTPGSKSNILRDPNDTSFLEYDYTCNAGDPYYINHTMQYVDQSEGPLIIYSFDKDENGNKYPVRIEFNINKTLTKSKTF